MILKHIETLSYCDGIQLFKASSPSGCIYMCVLVEVGVVDTYLCSPVTKDNLELYERGIIDLLAVYQRAHTFWSIQTNNIFLYTEATLIERGDVSDDWLPGAGYFNERIGGIKCFQI